MSEILNTKTRVAPETGGRSGPRISSPMENREGVGSRSSRRSQECATSTRQRKKSHEKKGTRMAVLHLISADVRSNEPENGKPSTIKGPCANNRNNTTAAALAEFTSVTHRSRQTANVISKELRKSHPCATRRNDYRDKGHAGRSLKSAHSCPTLTDLNNLKIECGNTSKSIITQGVSKHACNLDQVTKPVQALSRHLGKLHRNSNNLSKYAITGTLLPCAGREQPIVMTKPPRPPSWQHFVKESSESNEECTTHHNSKAVDPIAVKPSSGAQRCAYCKEPHPCCHSNEHRRAPARIKRTRSMLTIDEGELPDTELVISLSETEPMEFNLRETIHDDRIYLRENSLRCRKWLETVHESDYVTLPDNTLIDDVRVSNLHEQLPLETISISDETYSHSTSASDGDDDDDTDT